MEELILENVNLIYSITKYFEKYSNKDDLFQAGCLGMINAYNNFNPNMNVKFTTYAYPYILGEMKKLVREDKSIKISRDISKLNLKIEKAYVLLSQKLLRIPSLDEIADYLELPIYLVSEAINSNKFIYSIDEPINEDGKELTLQDTVGKCDNVDDLISLKEALGKLTPFERDLINKRYINDLTQQEVAKKLGKTQVKISRNEKKILTKLKLVMN